MERDRDLAGPDADLEHRCAVRQRRLRFQQQFTAANRVRDSGTGGQVQPTAGKLAANMKAAGIDAGSASPNIFT